MLVTNITHRSISPEIQKEESPTKANKPKRREEKSLPIIHNKQVPLHQIQSRKAYVNISKKQLQPKLWAYVPFSSKYNDNTKHDTAFPAVKGLHSLESSRSNESMDPSLTLLDKYFQRKHQKSLRDVVKFIEETADEQNASIGYEQINIFENVLKKKEDALSFFNSTKKMQFDSIEALFDSTKTKRPTRNVKVKSKFHSYIESYKNSIIDDYFLDRRQPKS